MARPTFRFETRAPAEDWASLLELDAERWKCHKKEKSELLPDPQHSHLKIISSSRRYTAVRSSPRILRHPSSAIALVAPLCRCCRRTTARCWHRPPGPHDARVLLVAPTPPGRPPGYASEKKKETVYKPARNNKMPLKLIGNPVASAPMVEVKGWPLTSTIGPLAAGLPMSSSGRTAGRISGAAVGGARATGRRSVGKSSRHAWRARLPPTFHSRRSTRHERYGPPRREAASVLFPPLPLASASSRGRDRDLDSSGRTER